jgi:hypothetical protein
MERAQSSKPHAIQQHFEMNTLSENDRAVVRGKKCRNSFCRKNLPRGMKL